MHYTYVHLIQVMSINCVRKFNNSIKVLITKSGTIYLPDGSILSLSQRLQLDSVISGYISAAESGCLDRIATGMFVGVIRAVLVFARL